MAACAIHTPLQTIAFYCSYLHQPYYFACRPQQIAAIMTYHIESWATFMLSVNRVIATVFPHSYRRFTSPPALAAMIAASWIVPASVDMLEVSDFKSAAGMVVIPSLIFIFKWNWNGTWKFTETTKKT